MPPESEEWLETNWRRTIVDELSSARIPIFEREISRSSGERGTIGRRHVSLAVEGRFLPLNDRAVRRKPYDDRVNTGGRTAAAVTH